MGCPGNDREGGRRAGGREVHVGREGEKEGGRMGGWEEGKEGREGGREIGTCTCTFS